MSMISDNIQGWLTSRMVSVLPRSVATGADVDAIMIERSMPGSGSCRRLALLAALCAERCRPAAMHWPWHATARRRRRSRCISSRSRRMRPRNAATITQYWDRNTLLLDLTRSAAREVRRCTPITAPAGRCVWSFACGPAASASLEVHGGAACALRGANTGRAAAAASSIPASTCAIRRRSRFDGARLTTRHTDRRGSRVIEIHRGERAAPDAAGVEAEQARRPVEAKRRPVAEHDARRRGWHAAAP